MPRWRVAVPPSVLIAPLPQEARPEGSGRCSSSKPSSSSSRAILGSAVHGLRASSRTRSASTSTRTSRIACWPKHYRPTSGGTGPSWLSFIGHTTDSLWSVDLFRCESIVRQSYWVLVVMDQFTRRLVGIGVHRGVVTGADLCRLFTPPFMIGSHRDISYGSRSPVRGASLDGEPADSGD